MAMGGEGSKRAVVAEINVTPLVDVMLVLLVIFMVTVPLLPQGVPVNLPRVETTTLRQAEEPVVVSVEQSGKTFINRDEVPSGELPARLTAHFAAREKKEVFLNADEGVPYGAVVRTLADIRNAGVERLGMLTRPDEE